MNRLAATIVVGVLVVLIVVERPPRAPHQAEAGRLVPWVVEHGVRHGRIRFIVNWHTPAATPSILLSASSAEKLQEAVRDTSIAFKMAVDGKEKYFVDQGVTLSVRRGFGAGRRTERGKKAYRANLHRSPLDIAGGETRHYVVWDGVEFVGPFSLEATTGTPFKVAHMGHTSLVFPATDDGVWMTFPVDQLDRLERWQPELLLHSGDAFLSVFNHDDMRRESLDTFAGILPRTPVFVSASNHDQGWPVSYDGKSPGLFRYLLPYRYERHSLHHWLDHGGWRFIAINYLDLAKEEERDATFEFMARTVSETQRPVVIVWGGSRQELWDPVAEFCKKHPRVRLVLGGDGGGYKARKLANGALMLRLAMFQLAELTFDKTRIGIIVWKSPSYHRTRSPKHGQFEILLR